MGGSWLQHRGYGPGRAAQQAGATRNGRGGYPWDFLLLFMPLIGGTIRVLWRSVREYYFGAQWEAPGFSIVASTPVVLPNRREPLGTAAGVTSVYPAP